MWGLGGSHCIPNQQETARVHMAQASSYHTGTMFSRRAGVRQQEHAEGRSSESHARETRTETGSVFGRFSGIHGLDIERNFIKSQELCDGGTAVEPKE